MRRLDASELTLPPAPGAQVLCPHPFKQMVLWVYETRPFFTRAQDLLEILVALDQEGSLLQRPGGWRQRPAPGRTRLAEWLPNSSALAPSIARAFARQSRLGR